MVYNFLTWKVWKFGEFSKIYRWPRCFEFGTIKPFDRSSPQDLNRIQRQNCNRKVRYFRVFRQNALVAYRFVQIVLWQTISPVRSLNRRDGGNPCKIRLTTNLPLEIERSPLNRIEEIPRDGNKLSQNQYNLKWWELLNSCPIENK